MLILKSKLILTLFMKMLFNTSNTKRNKLTWIHQNKISKNPFFKDISDFSVQIRTAVLSGLNKYAK